MNLHLDFETFSSEDLKSSGMYRYTESIDFEILLVAYAFGHGPVKIVDLASGEPWPAELVSAINDDTVKLHAHNAAFERTCLAKVGFVTDIDRWVCSAVLAAYCGLPRSLGEVSKVLGLGDMGKDSAGDALIRYFSIPVKPTKTNGMRRRNFPHHDPVKWASFKSYCLQDVVAEREIESRLAAYPLPLTERELYHLDQLINDRGVGIDMELVESSISIDVANAADLHERMVQLTGIDNPNSPTQLKAWLKDRIRYEGALDKEAVDYLLNTTWDPVVKELMTLRKMASRSAIKKYTAMKDCVCQDGRARGLFLHYGASRTGRWSGRLIQLQNLFRNSLDGLDLARELVRKRDADTLDMMYGDVSLVLAQLIRTALVPGEGKIFSVADFSAIEARVIAWLAGEQWRLDLFNQGGDIYKQSYAQMMGIPVSEVTKEGRQKGKVAELACIAEGQLVTTDKGLIPIEQITTEHKVYDGVNFVEHGGLVYKGIKKVLKYDGLRATEDHLVWVEGEQGPIHFGLAAACGKDLQRALLSWESVRERAYNIGGEALVKTMERRYGSHGMPNLPQHTVDEFIKSVEGKEQRLSRLLSASQDTIVVGSPFDIRKAEMHQSERRRLQELWSPWHTVPVRIPDGSGIIFTEDLRTSGQNDGSGSDKQRRSLRGGESEVLNKGGEQPEQKNNSSEGVGAEVLAVLCNDNLKEAEARDDKRTNNSGSKEGCIGEAEELAWNTEEVRVYDILNAGPNHRFTVSGVLVHNCGYGGAVGALTVMGGEKMGLSEPEMKNIVKKWRDANPNIVALWSEVEVAAKKACKNPRVLYRAKGLEFEHDTYALKITLPSGRQLFYKGAYIGEGAFSKDIIKYEGVDQDTKRWGWLDTYGPKIVENVVQGISRDLLGESMLNLHYSGFDLVMHVHDEAIAETNDDPQILEQMCEIMGRPVGWAPGLPLRADGYQTKYYKKE